MEKEIIIIKATEERTNKDIPEKSNCKKVYLLKYADHKFFYEDVTKYYDTIHQDRYSICHDIIADVFFEQIHSGSAYTSSSSLAGYFNMDTDGTLIFLHGQPHYVTDELNPHDVFFGYVEEY